MLLFMGIILGAISAFTEIKLVYGSKSIRHLYEDGLGPIDGIWFNTFFSFLLSYGIGFFFGAAGLTVMMGAVISTGMSQIWFVFDRGLKHAGIDMKTTKAKAAKTAQTTKDVYATCKAIVHVFTAPIRGIRFIKVKVNEIKVGVHNIKAKVAH